ncbi:hypothetical protein P153DRAFT_368437 [Dothidotthia symphoricarpi CBS 119687]|uniref:Zf-CHY-domain-containing protein n=1 Tax=Dothidotthia symphoricarpi CBS 119687 TaxID=1392245 RepID=A0A6A6A795_9PLEO|nr:uncharacterized protein P153DRAFT_368437 [Dothidotthia symphoricarpi CBS 119687]KAF2127095.1 hypothetical protein P153DRAFT_368437 [Dothidotthia symphoricarpi CBS 119687]
MSLISSFLIDPVVRHTRRWSATALPEASHDIARHGLSRESEPDHAAADAIATTSRVEDAPQTGDGRPTILVHRIRQFSSFTRRPHDAVVEEEEIEGELSASMTAPMDIPVDADMSSNPSRTRTLERQFHRLDSEPLVSSAPTTPITQSARSSLVAGQHAGGMSESLPADDGMAHFRARIHQIRDLKITDHERARMVHNLMTERYNLMRPTSPSSFYERPHTPTSGRSVYSDVNASSPNSAASDVDPENPYNLRSGDTSPTYRPSVEHGNADHGEEEEDETTEGERVLGCQHYKRNVKVQCYECRHWYTCRHCHDAEETHNLDRKRTQNMLCMACGTPQSAAGRCENCGIQAACYYCDICKLWDNNSKKKIYHCADCGICRRGEGLGKDYSHCKNCNVCISISHATSHKCLPRATDSNCPICGDYLFTSSSAVVSMPCGHYLHKGCYNLYMETAYKCPLCKKSAVCMDLQWQKLTQAIESQPMPEQFENTRAIVQCNDCSAKSSVKYHWLGNQCGTCDSYNTNELRILNGPESEEAANAILDADADDGARSPISVSSPTNQPLRSPRYYFQPEEPEETWLPGQLPSFPFQMPQFPGRPRMLQMPQMPQMPQFTSGRPRMPQFPSLPQLPQFPNMPDTQQLLDRVRRSFDAYLNPTGEIRAEDVPFIDLVDDDRRERRATDGTTVKEPSLPQYVLERFTQSLARFRNDLNPGMEDIPSLDLDEDLGPEELQSWVDHVPAGDEDDEDEESSSDGSAVEDDDEEDEGDTIVGHWGLDLPGHR